MTPVLELKEITLEYPKSQSLLTIIKRKVLRLIGKNATAPHYKGLDEVNLTINRGEVIGVIGRNGSSKCYSVEGYGWDIRSRCWKCIN